jgi:choline dehydrogenase
VPIHGRPNLTIRDRTLVRRVLVQAGRVTGVEVLRDGIIETIDCDRVVLSAGSIQTPSILVRSGIGPRDVLESLGIPVLVDLPAVGAKLIDHPGILIALLPFEGIASLEDPAIQTTLRYTSRGSARPNDMQLQPISSFQIENGPVLMGIASVVGKPRAHGRLLFTSADPAIPPSILPHLLGDDDDVERLLEGVDLAIRAARTEALSKLGMVVWPMPDVFETRATMATWARTNCHSGYHPVGTAPMGPEGDPSAAVDQYGRVRGVSGLFVADASIMPTITSSNTNLPSIMIGERFGEWFREGLA